MGLLGIILRENEIDIAGLCETYKSGKATMKIEGYRWIGNEGTEHSCGVGFLIAERLMRDIRFIGENIEDKLRPRMIAVEAGRLAIIEAYAPVNSDKQDIKKDFMGELAMMIAMEEAKGMEVLIMGDMNAHLLGHRSDKTNDNGYSILKISRELKLEVLNLDNITFTGRGNSPSCIDYILMTQTLKDKIRQSQVLEDNTVGSDHLPLLVQVAAEVTDANNEIREAYRLDLLNDPDKREAYQKELEKIINGTMLSNDPGALYEEIIGIFNKAARISLGIKKHQAPTLPRSVIDRLKRARRIYSEALENLKTGNIATYLELLKIQDKLHKEACEDLKKWKKMSRIEKKMLSQQMITQDSA